MNKLWRWGMAALLGGMCSVVGIAHADHGFTQKLALAEQVVVRKQETKSALPESVIKVMQKYHVPEDELSVFVQDMNADQPMLLFNPDVPRNPASTMKLLTTWVALKELGSAFHWNTEAWLRGDLKSGVLKGDLILKGYGDPFLVYESFWQMLLELRLKGLQEIDGNVLIDNSYFDKITENAGDFDNSPERVYNAVPSALMFNFQATRFTIVADSATQTVRVETFPTIPPLKIDNEMQFKDGSCQSSYYAVQFVNTADGRLRVKGNYSPACDRLTVVRLFSNPEDHAFNAFREFWTMLGGKMTGHGGTTIVEATDKRYYAHVSAPLADQIRSINKWSNNVMTRSLLLTLGAKLFEAPATEQKGEMAVKQYLEQQGINTQGLVVNNGAGLSRDARVTARLMGEMLKVAWRDPDMPEFVSSLPLLGEDGTLHNRFKRQDLRGRAHLKTGTLRDVSALSGYMLNRKGKYLVVVIQHHGSYASRAGHAVQDALLEWLFEQ